MARRDVPSRLAVSLFLAVSCASFTACGGPSAEEERAIARLERLVFVPPGVCSLGLEGLDCSNEEALLVDRYEVTQREWLDFLSRRTGVSQGQGGRVWSKWQEDSGTLPATFMTQAEALEFASSEGMRIPSNREWLRISAGTRAQPWPWGTSPARSVANTLDLGLPGALGVGTFEAGATPSGVYDLVGNVREWVTVKDEKVNELSSAMGGSWLSHQQPLYDWDSTRGLRTSALEVDPRHRSIDLGMRLTASAERYLRREATSWGSRPGSQARVRAVGERWGRPAVELLQSLADEGVVGVEWLLKGARG